MSSLPTEKNKDWFSSANGFVAPAKSHAGKALDLMIATCSDDIDGYIGDDQYFESYKALTQTEIRRLWLAEGKKRGYELTNA